MRFITVGTSCGFPLPGRKCECNCLEINGSLYFFDAGADISEAVVELGYKFKDVKAVFVTHSHADHTLGVAHFVEICSWWEKSSTTAFYLPTEKCVDYLRNMQESLCSVPINPNQTFHVYRDGEVYRDENITVTAYPSSHIKDAHSLLVEAEGKRILITGDLDRYMESLTSTAYTQPHDIILTECAHFPESVVLEKFPKLNAKRLLITHVGLDVPVAKLEKWIEDGKIFGEICNDYDEYEL